MKDDYVRRLEMKLDIEPKKTENNTCRFCNVRFTRRDNLTTHLSVCQEKDKYEKMLEKQLKEKDLCKGRRNETHITNNNNTRNNNINSHNTNNININMRPFGKENMDYITREVILKLCNQPNFRNEIIPRLVKHVHCNPEHPENHNILITNLRAPYGQVYDGDSYKVETTNDIMDKVIDNVTDKLTDAYLDNEDGQFDLFEKAITKLDEDILETDSRFKADQRTRVKRNMYNNKRMLENTKKIVR